MHRFFKIQLMASLAALSFSFSCKESAMPTSASDVKSDWEELQVDGEARSYVIDWSCEPKRFGAKAEKTISNQEEYCEWKTEKVTDTEKTCRFTTSFNRKKDFFLNSRGKTSVNSISAARFLVDLCTENALRRLKSGQSVGTLCNGVSTGCVNGRNSDPEICSKVRWAVGERYNDRIDFCVDKLTQRDSTILPDPLMQFGLLVDIPDNCSYTSDDHTEVLCTVPAEDDCFSVAGQLRVGMRVQTKAKGSEAELPATRECYVP